jgi:hypothetical protein
MAILKKRTSSKQIPDAKALTRAPLSSVINGVGNTPNVTSGGAGSITSGTGSTGGGSNTPSITNIGTGTSSKPSITNNASSTTKPTLTTSTTGAPRQTLTSATKPSSSTSKGITNALTGAAIGAGTKLLIDKFSSKPNVSKTPTQVAAEKKAINTSVSKDKAAAATAAKAKADAAKAKADAVKPKAPPTSVVKPPVTNPATGKPTGTGFGDEKEEFTTDSLGNTYKTMPDGTSVLYRAAEVAEDEFMTDSLGNVYKTMPDGSYELYRAAEVEEDVDAYPPNTVPDRESLSPDEEIVDEPQYFDDGYGNIYIMNSNGEFDLYRAAEVDEFPEEPIVDEEQYYDDGSGNIYTLNDSGEYELYRAAEVPEDIVEEDYNLFNPDFTDNIDNTDYNDYNDYDVNDRYSTYDDGDEYFDYRRGGLITMMKNGGMPNFEDGGYVDNGDGTYSIDNYVYDMETDDYLYTIDSNGGVTNINDDYIYETPDIISSGGGSRNWYDDYIRPIVSGGSRLATDALGNITGALGTTAGAAGAGALIATLLGQDFGGGTGNQNQGIDMSKVGVINPRTTDFGIGPTNFVGYEDYGTGGGGYTPNEELLRNLNAPGFNPVREGDYGYEEPAEEAPKMASGGLSSMATPVASYYTFGQPADILANLGMRAQPPMNPPEMMPQIGQQQQPQQMQQQGLPQQAPPQMAQQVPQGMPQQGMMPQQQGMPPPMRKGGLPHVSDVPLTQGRMDFRKGAAVHGEGDGQSDDIPAMLADGEYVIDAETVAQIGNGSTKAGAQALDKFREGIRAHKRSAPLNKIPPKTKALTSYLKGAK